LGIWLHQRLIVLNQKMIQVMRNILVTWLNPLFPEETNVNEHQAECSYLCDMCKKVFRSQKSLQVHTHIHSRQRRNSCDVCQKVIKKQNYLQVCKHIVESFVIHVVCVENHLCSCVTWGGTYRFIVASVCFPVMIVTSNLQNTITIRGTGKPFIVVSSHSNVVCVRNPSHQWVTWRETYSYTVVSVHLYVVCVCVRRHLNSWLP
jgi:hypothetical protein